MGKITSNSARNIDGAGAQAVQDAIENASDPGTQVSVEEFQESLADTADDARPAVDEEDWEEVSGRAEETETGFEKEIDSRAEKYSEQGWEAVPEEDASGEQSAAADEADGFRPEAQPGDRDPVRRDPEYQDPDDVAESRFGNDEVNAAGASTLGETIDDNNPLYAEIRFQEPGESSAGATDPGAGVALSLNEHHFDDAEAALAGDETVGLPEEKELSNAFEELARDDVSGIDLDSLEAPEETPGPSPEGESGSYQATWERIGGEQAELEYYAQEATARYNAGESPAAASRHAINETDTRDRPWQGEDEGPATGESFVHRFVESAPSVSTNQAPAVHQAIAQRQPGNEIDLASHIRSETNSGTAGQKISERMDVDVGEDNHVSQGLVESGSGEGYSSTYEAIADGQTLIDDSVEPAPAAQELSASNHSYIGEQAVENLREAGYTRVADLADATVDDLTAVDGIGEKKATKIIDNEGETARKLERTAQRLDDQIRSDEFGASEYRRILTYAAEKGLPVEVGETIFSDPEVQKEIPGPTSVTDLRPGDGEQRAYGNNRHKWVDTHETADNQSYNPSGDRYSYQASVTVEATVEQTFEPEHPEYGERQVVQITDHQGNTTKFTVYSDSVKEWDDEETSAAVGQFHDGETDPSTGIGPNVVLEPGDTISIKSPQVNDYGGGDGDPWDGPTLATTPDTTIQTDAPPRRDSEGTVAEEWQPRGAPSKETRQSAPDYVEGDSRNLRRRKRQNETEAGGKTIDYSDVQGGDGADEDRNINDVDADI